ncbi:MAG: ABC transporter permease [Acidimicrobiia bacterium]|nr:ABC transporter permease [Acidimicrobiia bacterium]
MTGAQLDESTTVLAPAAGSSWPARIGLQVGALVVVVGLWALAADRGWVSERILPPPLDVWRSFWNLLTDGILFDHLGVTLWEVFAGFVLGSAGGFLIAVAGSLWVPFRRVIYPYMVALQVTPRVAIAPLLFIWLGFGAFPKIVLAATICFFPVMINTLTGLTIVDEESDELFRSLGATRRQRFFRLALPGAMPVIFAGLKTAISLALIGAIVGEFVSAQEGLGLLIQRFSFQLNSSAAYAVLLTLTAIGLALYGLMELIDRWVVFWNRDERLAKRSERAAARNARAKAAVARPQRISDQ